MIKTVKELFERIKDIYKSQIREDWIVLELEEAVENALAEKDKLIASAEDRIESAYEKKLIEYDELFASEENRYEKILIEKDKEIEWLQNNWINKQNELTKLQDIELYKEDFDYIVTGIHLVAVEKNIIIKFKDNSKYYKLPSKEELK